MAGKRPSQTGKSVKQKVPEKSKSRAKETPSKSKGSKTTLNAANLESLGAKRLAELLLEIGTGNAAAKRLLRLELAGAQSPQELAREVAKRLNAIARARAFVDWQNRRALVEDLDAQRRAIVTQIAKADPVEAYHLIWRFIALANSIFDRCDDSSGTVIGIFHQAVSDLGEIAKAAKIEPETLAEQAFAALVENSFGQYDGLIERLAPALGQQGLEHLKQHMIALSNKPVQPLAPEERVTIGWSSSGPIYQDQIDAHTRVSTVRLALMEIADAQDDVDAFIAQYNEKTRKVPRIAAEIAQRLLKAGRAQEAWQAVEAAEHRSGSNELLDFVWPDFEWEDARIDALEALDRKDEAQATRWSCFERALSAEHLRAYLERLPDFDDVEAERRALDHAQGHSSVLWALSFLVSWPALERAAALVCRRSGEVDGNHYEILKPAADALSAKHPLAATLVLRAMIDFTLQNARSSRYRHAARHLLECESLAASTSDFGSFETHETYLGQLHRDHGRKTSFWGLLD